MLARSKLLIRSLLRRFGYDIVQVPRRLKGSTPGDRDFYKPFFSPWLGYGEFGNYLNATSGKSAMSIDAIYFVYAFARYAVRLPGEVWECGVYKGGTARMLSQLSKAVGTPGQILRLFDTFSGMPPVDNNLDMHHTGDFAETSVEAVRALVGSDYAVLHPGYMPDTFIGLENSRIAFAHIDVDIYQSMVDCCEFIYPRMVFGGALVFHDYGDPSAPGVRPAVDGFFKSKPETIITIPTGQAVVIKLPQ